MWLLRNITKRFCVGPTKANCLLTPIVSNRTKHVLPFAFYLPSVAEVYNIHVGLPDVPLEVLRAFLLLQVHREDKLVFLPVSLQHSRLRLRHYRTIQGVKVLNRGSADVPSGLQNIPPSHRHL